MSKNIIEVSNLSVAYGNEKILKNIDLSIKNNQIIGLCGPNGAGKTTLIKVLVGLLKDYSGIVTIDNLEIGKKSKSIVSYQPDIITIDQNLTGNKVLKIYPKLYSDFNSSKFIALTEKLKLSLNKPIKKMSKGMKEKFQLALTLARDAQVYIFDEPIAGVDPASRDSILETIIANFATDALLIISTHLISDIESILDEVIFINEGVIKLHENCDDLRLRKAMSIDEIFREEFKW